MYQNFSGLAGHINFHGVKKEKSDDPYLIRYGGSLIVHNDYILRKE